MKLTIYVVVTCLVMSGGALGAEAPDCYEASAKISADPNVPAAAKRRARAACDNAHKSERCDQAAEERKLSGSARETFMARCMGLRVHPARRP